MENNKETFEYTYSAAQHAEIEKTKRTYRTTDFGIDRRTGAVRR